MAQVVGHGGDEGKAAQNILFSLHVACVAQSRDDETEFFQWSFPWRRQRRWGKLLYPSLCLCAYSSMLVLSSSSPMHSLFSHLFGHTIIFQISLQYSNTNIKMSFLPIALAIALVTVPSSADAKGKIVNIFSWQSSTENVNVDAPAAAKDTITKGSDAFDHDERQLPIETINTEYCFTSKEALQIVLNAYIDQECSTISDCAVRQKYGEIGTWCTTGITDMSSLFKDSYFNDDISGWDVSSVTDMSNMFDCAWFFDQPLDGWNVSSVTDMSSMFRSTRFNQPLDGWDVGSVTTMEVMFTGADFNQSLNGWNVSSVTNMAGLFYGAASFNQPIGEWKVGSVTTMDEMFSYATGFNQPLDGWDVSKVTLMGSMFRNQLASIIFDVEASTFNQPLNSWDVSMVTDMSYMFSYAIRFNQPLDGWNVSSVTSMYGMFADASGFNQNLCAWGQFSSFPYEDCSGMFSGSGCNYEDFPMQAIAGPFCASDCLTFAYI